MVLTFEWDEVKNILNRRKHGIWFEEAQSVFDDPLARIFVAHCYRKASSVIRLISARKATRKERKTYEKRV